MRQSKGEPFYEDEHCRAVLRTDNQVWLARYILVPRVHLDPLIFWGHPTSAHVMRVHPSLSKAILDVFGALCVQMAQLGGLTVDETNQPTTDQRYQHAHVHGIPRYEKTPLFAGKLWPDPQFKDGKFSALNLDVQQGLPKVVPTEQEVGLIANALRACLQ